MNDPRDEATRIYQPDQDSSYSSREGQANDYQTPYSYAKAGNKKDLIKRRKIFLRGRKSQKKFVQKRNVRGGKSF
ncbi:hypothetical protein EHR_12000 [Enterococcus hirae ATCC 9790]|uniref:Uncharacterized protein n=1 Tax=Enterococcus hirae (strain ATCC 9790 / DSM 20160 / JCM 8729 / LMG 6399 / NBRC 3181 / NCIMB 6459 / NCDO 1258 / NCTC 12367 / WDCM 00089 / R) TaxID=768486 RepID=I6TCX2_ENTHA|nr:hypothetical protein EHR_12000 [Enterococcus hirae ATCC 9790]